MAKGFTTSLKSGLKSAPKVAISAVKSISTALMSGRALAFAAGSFISIGFAQGMLSQLAIIRSAAAQMAVAADKALRAKAKIHSPSDLTDDAGGFFGEGWVNGILRKVKAAKAAAMELVSVPEVNTPKLAYAYSGELTADYDYYRNNEYTISVPVTVDGREVAKATATYTQEEINKKQAREDRKHGKI